MFMIFRKILIALYLPLLPLIAGSLPANSFNAQTVDSSDQKAEQIVRRAVEAVGGSKYLDLKTVVARGFYTIYREGVTQLPARFVDYIAYPDKEKTEFTGEGIRTIQVNNGDGG